MNHWDGFVTVLSGLVATVLLAGSVYLTKARGEARIGVLRMISAAGLAATALFGAGILYRLVSELARALAAWP